MIENDNVQKKGSSLRNSDRMYESWLSRYYGNRFLYPQAYVSKKIKKFLSEGFLPQKAELLYDLGRFLYLEMKSDNIAIEWLAITLIDQASSDGLAIATKFLELFIKEHRIQAQNGLLISLSLLGRYLALKDSSSVEAGMWLKEAADKDDPESEHLLSICYLSGLCGLEEDKVKAKKYAQRAVDHGNLEATFNLGCFYADGIGCEKDIGEAEEYLKIARDEGHPNAQEELDNLYSAEKTQSKPDTSLEWKKAYAEGFKAGVSQFLAQDFDELKRGQEEIKQTITDSKNELKQGQQEIKGVVKSLSDSFDEVKSQYCTDFCLFEALQFKMSEMHDDISEIKESTNKTEEQIEAILEVSQMNNEGLEELISKMNQFFVGMEEKCIAEANSSERQSLRVDCEAELASLFGKYWGNKDDDKENKKDDISEAYLLKSTKESLIAARVLLACAERENLTDCRGIVISATSALERELKARFYTGLQLYFKEQKDDKGNVLYSNKTLPEPLKLNDKQEDYFTLGQFTYTVNCGTIPLKYPIDSKYNDHQKEIVRSYLIECIISDNISTNSAFDKSHPDKVFTDSYTGRISSINKKYRINAAHTNNTCLEDAQDCCNAVIGESRTDIENIESCLLDLLKLTEKFKHKI